MHVIRHRTVMTDRRRQRTAPPRAVLAASLAAAVMQLLLLVDFAAAKSAAFSNESALDDYARFLDRSGSVVPGRAPTTERPIAPSVVNPTQNSTGTRTRLPVEKQPTLLHRVDGVSRDGAFADRLVKFEDATDDVSHVDNNENRMASNVELWNTSSLTDLDLLPEELPNSVKMFFAISYGVIIVTSVSFNVLVVFVVAVCRKLRTVTNVFFVSLAVSDLLIATVNMPLQLLSVLHDEWTVGGEPLCKITNYLQGVVIVSSILTLTAIAIDRYYAICRPLEARHLHTVRRAAIFVGAFWLLSATVVAPQLFVQRLEPVLVLDVRPPPSAVSSTAASLVVPTARVRLAYMCVEYFTELRWNVAYTLFYYVVLYVLPMMTMFIAYGRIAATLWRRTPPGEQLEHDGSGEAGAKRLAERKRIVCMLVIIVGLFTLSWFPFFTAQVYALFIDYPDHADPPPEGANSGTSTSLRTVIACLQLVAYTNCAINPVVYCLLNERFQLHMRKMARSLVRLLAVRRRRRRTRQRQIRRNTLSETLQRVNGPVHASGNSRPNATRETAMTAGGYVGPYATANVAHNGVSRSRPDTLEMNCSRQQQRTTTLRAANGDDDDDDVSKSTDEVGGPFTPSTEELPVCNLFDDEGDVTPNGASSNPAEEPQIAASKRRQVVDDEYRVGIDNVAADC